MWSIISSCIVTIFSCTWVAIHPNIPDLDEKWYKTVLRKLGIMLTALIIPELIVLWSIQQWSVAGKLAEMYSADYNWTRTHGFFAAMGGFMVESDDGPLVLSPWKLELYLQSGQIEITEREIQDKSKGDILSKGLVVVQTGWFILQCLARAIEHLPITELELVTLAYATLNFAIYGFWWYKPLNVQCPCFVGKRSGPRSQPSENKEEDDSRQVGGIWKWLWIVFKPMNILFGIKLWPGAKRVPIFYSGFDSVDDYWNVVAVIGTVFGAIHCVAWSFHFPSDTERLLWRVLSLTITTIPSASLFIGVPVLMLLAFWACWAVGCGNSRERRVYEFLLGLWGPFITLTGPILYASARIGLLILSLVSLRSLTVDTYQTVHWTTFIPHV